MTPAEEAKIVELIHAVKGYMTVRDIEEEYGFPDGLIRKLCTKYKIKPVTPKEVAIQYIKDMSHTRTLSEIAQTLDKCEAYIADLAQAAGVYLRKERPIPKEEPLQKEEIISTQSYMDRIHRNALYYNIQERIKAADASAKPRYKDTYNQSGSPYGIADEIRGVKIK